MGGGQPTSSQVNSNEARIDGYIIAYQCCLMLRGEGNGGLSMTGASSAPLCPYQPKTSLAWRCIAGTSAIRSDATIAQTTSHALA